MIEVLRRNRRLAITIVIVVALIVLNFVFLMQWQSAEDERSKVETEKQVAQVNLTQTRVQYDLDTLRAREAELSRNPDFPMSMPVVGLSLFFAGGSEQTNVVINEVVPPSAVGQETIGSKNYPAYATQVTVSGTLNQIISFLQYLEAGGFSSIRVQNLSTAGTGVLWTATITTVVISQT